MPEGNSSKMAFACVCLQRLPFVINARFIFGTRATKKEIIAPNTHMKMVMDLSILG
jgi:hypothetical protein